MVASLGSLQIDITLATATLEKQLADLEARLGGISSGFNGAGSAAAGATTGIDAMADAIARSNAGFEVIGSAAKMAFDSIKGYAQGGVNLFKSFEGGLNSFKAIANATPKEVAELSKVSLQLAKDTTKTAPEVAKAAVEYAKLGNSASTTTKELGGLVSMAEASGIGVEKAAAIVGAGSNVFGRSALDIANIVSATANASAVNAEDMLQAFSKAGAVFKANQQDLETLSTSFGLLRQAGNSAETAATALKTSITSLAAPSKKGQAGIDQLGVSVRDAKGNMKNFLDLIPEFRAGLDKVDISKRAQITKDIFGAEAGPAVIGLIGTDQAKIDEVRNTVNKAAKDGVAAKDTAAKLITGFSGALEQLSGSLETIQLKVGESLAPILTSLAVVATTVANAFIGLPAPLQAVAIGFAGAATAAIGLVVAVTTLNTLQLGTKLVEGAAQAKDLFTGVAKAVSAVPSGGLFSDLPSRFASMGTSAKSAFEVISSGSSAAIGGLTKIAGVAGLAVLAAYALSEAFRGFQLATGQDESTASIDASTAALKTQIEEARRARGEIGQLNADLAAQKAESANPASFENVQGYIDELLKSLKEGGPIQVMQELANDTIAMFLGVEAKVLEVFASILGKLNDMIQTASGFLKVLPGGDILAAGAGKVAEAVKDKAKDKAKAAQNFATANDSDYGNEGTVTKNSQKEAQNNLEAIGRLQAKVNAATSDGNKILAQYGLTQASSANAEKLTTQEKAKFIEQAKSQVAIYDSTIAAYKKTKPLTEDQKKTVEAEIATLEKSKKAYGDRIALVEKSTTTTQKAVAAQVDQSAALEKESTGVLSKLKADVAEQVAAGQITEEEGQQLVLDKEREYFDKRIALNKTKIAELLKLKKAGASPEDAKKIDEQISALNIETDGLREKSAKNKAQSQTNAKRAGDKAKAEADKAQKEAQDKAAKAEQFTQLKETSSIKIGESNAINQVRQGVLAGSIDESDSSAKIAGIKARSASQELASEQNKLGRLRAMAASGLMDKEKAANEELQIGQRLAQLELAQTDARIAVQEAARKKILEDIERANKKAEAALKLNVTEQTSAVRSQQLGGGLTDQQAEAKITEITQRQTIANYDLVQQKIAQTTELRKKGTITEKQAQDKLIDLEQQRADLNLQRISGELAARKKLQEEQIKAIDDQAKRAIGTLQAQQGAIGAILTGLKGQQELLNAQDGLNKAKDDLALQQMEARGATEQEIAAFKSQIMDREQSHALQMLDLSIQMRQLEAERELRSARIAEIEARIAISKATINGASEQEIALLTEALQLRQQNVAEAENAIARQAQIGDLQRETLLTQQEGAREKVTTEAAKKAEEAAKKTEDDKKKPDATKPSGGNTAIASGGGSVTTRNLFGQDIEKDRAAARTIQQLQTSGAKESDFAKAALSDKDNVFFLQRLQDMGLGDIVNLANADKANKLTMEQKNKIDFGGEKGFEELINELKNLNSNVTGALKEPKSISVSTATPTSDLLNIMGSSRGKRG